jgi:hypothetical protein
LTELEQAFVAGYLCHLAADEAWLEVSWHLLRELGIEGWDDLAIPAEVMLVTFNMLSRDLFEDFPSIACALDGAAIPEVFAHVPQDPFRRMWDLAQPYILEGGGLASYLALLEGQGASDARITTVRRHSRRYGDGATALIKRAGGIERFARAAVDRAVQVVPLLWIEGPFA